MALTATQSSEPKRTSAAPRAAPAAAGRVPAVAGAAGKSAGGQAARGYPQKDNVPVRGISAVTVEEISPRLMAPDDSMVVGAPLLPELEDNAPEERFCMDGPVISSAGMPARRTAGDKETVLPFPRLVAHMERAVSQASLLLNERLRILHARSQKAEFSESQVGELCKIADGVAAASYHVQKWAHLLAPGEGEEGFRKPTKPGQCGDKAEAFAAIHCATPRIIVASSGAYKGFKKAIEEQGDKAELTVNRIGVATEDIRALAPHLEAVLYRLSNLSSKLRPAGKVHGYVPQDFAPALGPKLAETMSAYVDMGQVDLDPNSA